eukprot:Pgem_evm1s15076
MAFDYVNSKGSNAGKECAFLLQNFDVIEADPYHSTIQLILYITFASVVLRVL